LSGGITFYYAADEIDCNGDIQNITALNSMNCAKIAQIGAGYFKDVGIRMQWPA